MFVIIVLLILIVTDHRKIDLLKMIQNINRKYESSYCQNRLESFYKTDYCMDSDRNEMNRAGEGTKREELEDRNWIQRSRR